jgi:hypothetical protein
MKLPQWKQDLRAALPEASPEFKRACAADEEFVMGLSDEQFASFQKLMLRFLIALAILLTFGAPIKPPHRPDSSTCFIPVKPPHRPIIAFSFPHRPITASRYV